MVGEAGRDDLRAIQKAGGVLWLYEWRRLLLRKALGLEQTDQERWLASFAYAGFNAEAVLELFERFAFEISLEEALERLGLPEPKPGVPALVRESSLPTDDANPLGRLRRVCLKAALGFDLTEADAEAIYPYSPSEVPSEKLTVDEVHLLMVGTELPLVVGEALVRLDLHDAVSGVADY